MSTKQAVNLILFGSLSPITYAHLRTMEQAKDILSNLGKIVKKGFISPVSDGYKKKDLVSATHRAAMVRLSVENSDWLELNTWEIEQDDFTPTLKALQEIKKLTNPEIPLLMVCGADLLESMKYPNIWLREDVDGILSQFGLVVISRAGYNISDIINEDNIFQKNKDNIYIAEENILNSVSSTYLRKSIRENQSIKYLTPDKVISYIKENNLWMEEN